MTSLFKIAGNNSSKKLAIPHWSSWDSVQDSATILLILD